MGLETAIRPSAGPGAAVFVPEVLLPPSGSPQDSGDTHQPGHDLRPTPQRHRGRGASAALDNAGLVGGQADHCGHHHAVGARGGPAASELIEGPVLVLGVAPGRPVVLSA